MKRRQPAALVRDGKVSIGLLLLLFYRYRTLHANSNSSLLNKSLAHKSINFCLTGKTRGKTQAVLKWGSFWASVWALDKGIDAEPYLVLLYPVLKEIRVLWVSAIVTDGRNIILYIVACQRVSPSRVLIRLRRSLLFCLGYFYVFPAFHDTRFTWNGREKPLSRFLQTIHFNRNVNNKI